MKKIGFIVNADKISSNAHGGASVLYSHLELLYKAGFEVVLLTVLWNEQYVYKDEDYTEILPFVKEINQYKAHIEKPKKGISRLIQAFFNPAKFEYYFINKKNSDFINQFVKDKKLDAVIAEWRWAAIWSWQSKLKIPVVYSHHDWEYKLALLRSKPTLNKRFHTFQKKRVEMSLVKEVAACISGSATEVAEIELISGKKSVYIPTTYQNIKQKLSKNKTPNLVHLGGMGTTANRLGLERFLDVCWSDLKQEFPSIQLKIIGSINRAQPSLQEKLKDQNIECLDFVADLDTVMRPQDIHIVPWEYNTGTRTRIPVVLNYKQVLVATKASVKCYPEITSENSVLCDDLQQMTTKIVSLYSDIEKLHLLSEKGKETFVNTFTVESQVDRLKDFLKPILS